MKGEIWNPGEPVKRQDLDNAGNSAAEAVRERQIDTFTPGVLRDSQAALEAIPFLIAPDGGLTVKVGTGTAFAPHSSAYPQSVDNSDLTATGGERAFIPLADVATGQTYADSPGAGPGTGTGTGAYKETADGLGGWTSTPQSTKTRSIPLVNGSVNRVWMRYMATIDTSVTSLHKVSGKILFPRQRDGYEIVVNQLASPPAGDLRYTFLGQVDLTSSPGSVTTGLIDQSAMAYARTRAHRVAFRYEPATLAPLVVPTPGTTIPLETMLNWKGTGTATVNNIYGLSLADLGFTEDPNLVNHERLHHSPGLVVPNPASTTSALFPNTTTTTIVAGSAGTAYLRKLTGSEQAVVGGVVYTAVFPQVAVASGPMNVGDAYVSFFPADAPGVYQLYLSLVGSQLTYQKTGYTADNDHYLVDTVNWTGAAFSPTTPVDNRLFGTVANQNVQANAITTGNIQAGAITNTLMAANSVTTANITALNVTTGTLADMAVTTAKLADQAVTTAKHALLSVTTAVLADLSVTTGKVVDAAVTTPKLGDLSVTSQKIALADGTTGQTTTTGSGVKTAHIQDGAVTAAKLDALAFGAVGNSLKSKLRVAAPTTSTVTIAADMLSVQGVILSAVSLTASTASSGANGIDSGALAASTWYAAHVITNNSGSTVASLLSLSPTSPTLPGGYTKFRRVGWARSNASSLINRFFSKNDWVFYNDSNIPVFSSPSGTSSFSTAIPSTSQYITFSGQLSGPGAGSTMSMAITGTSMPGAVVCGVGEVVASSGFSVSGGWNFATNASQQIDITFPYTSLLTVLAYYDDV